MNCVSSSDLSLKYKRFTLLDCQDISIRKFEFVTKLNSFLIWNWNRRNLLFSYLEATRSQRCLVLRYHSFWIPLQVWAIGKLVPQQSKYVTETNSSTYVTKTISQQSKYVTETTSSAVQIRHRNYFFSGPNTSQKLVPR